MAAVCGSWVPWWTKYLFRERKCTSGFICDYLLVDISELSNNEKVTKHGM